ncbi:hypothetical protein HKD37_11G032808 [Glycine soja]
MRQDSFIETRVRRQLQANLWVVAHSHESLLRQKARSRWIKEGDCNSRYFHLMMNASRRHNLLKGIMSEGGWVDEPQKVKEVVKDFFQKRFHEPVLIRLTLEGIRGKLEEVSDVGFDHSKIPRRVVEKLIRIQRNFLWGDCVGEVGNELWAKILDSKYGGWRGLDAATSDNNTSLWWADLKLALHHPQHQTALQENIACKVGNENKVNFWEDNWGQGGNTFSKIFQTNHTMQQMGQQADNEWEWNFKWRRHLFDSELAMADCFLTDVVGIRILPHCRDEWIWKPESSGQYSVRSSGGAYFYTLDVDEEFRTPVQLLVKDGPGRSSHQQVGQKVTWRDKAGITTFYFSRFPEGMMEKDLWRIFQKWGKNKLGHRFGFVRFKGVMDEQRLERQLDNNIFIDGVKVFVNRPKFERGKVVNTREKGTSIRGEGDIPQVYKDGNGDKADQVENNIRDKPRSYATVVKEPVHGETEPMKSLVVMPGSDKTNYSPVILQSTKANSEWISKAWTARLKNRGMFERLEEELKWVVEDDSSPCYWADDWVIFPDMDESKAARLIDQEKDNGSTPISELQKWSPEIRPTHRLTWVLLWGLPLTVWEEELMAKVLAEVGEVVEVDEYVEARRRLDVARILVRTQKEPLLQANIPAIIDGIEYVLQSDLITGSKDDFLTHISKDSFHMQSALLKEMGLSCGDQDSKAIWGDSTAQWDYVPSVQAAGGLLCMWNNSTLEVVRRVKSRSFLMLEGRCILNDQRLVIVNVYAPCDLDGKKALWDDLRQLKVSNPGGLWCVLGDFNSIRSAEERVSLSQRRIDPHDIATFNQWISDLELQEIKSVGPNYTWIRPNGHVKSRLDRFLVSDQWLSLWPDCCQHVLQRDLSDHCPIILQTNMVDWGPKPFRVFDWWLQQKQYQKLVRDTWSNDQQGGWGSIALKNKLKNLKAVLKQWSKGEGTVDANKISSIQKKLNEMEDLASNRILSDQEIQIRNSLQQDLWNASNALESLLRQKSRVSWLKEGDCNSGYFHRIINYRRAYNAIPGIYIDGVWVQQPISVKKAAVNYFQTRFTEQNYSRPQLDGLEYPFLYLGIPIGANPSSQLVWEPLINKFKSKLAKWAQRDISMAGKIALINSQKYHQLFLISRQQKDHISQMGHFTHNIWTWDLRWRRNLFDHESLLVVQFMEDISSVPIQRQVKDNILWLAESNGQYSTSNGLRLLVTSSTLVTGQQGSQTLATSSTLFINTTIWRSWWVALTWSVWQLRNKIIFSSGTFNGNKLMEDSLFLLWTWLRNYEKDFISHYNQWSSNLREAFIFRQG